MTEAHHVSPRDQRRREVLAAAAARLGSVAFDWRKGLTFDLLEADTGIDRKTISHDFGNKQKLTAALIDYCLDPDNFAEFGEPWAADLVEETVAQLLDPNIDLIDSLTAVGNLDFAYVRHDARLRSQLAIWSLALDEPDARQSLQRMYEFYDAQHRDIWTAFVEALAETGITARDGLTISEVVAALTGLVEGLAIRWHVDAEVVSEDLFGRVFAGLACGLFVAEGTGPDSIAGYLGELDQIRRSGPAGERAELR